MKATLQDLRNRAIDAIARGEQVCYDVAANHGQIFGNVKHMHWFVKAVMEEIASTTKKYEHLA